MRPVSLPPLVPPLVALLLVLWTAGPSLADPDEPGETAADLEARCAELLEGVQESTADLSDPETSRQLQTCALEVDGFFEAFEAHARKVARDHGELALRASRVSLDLDLPEEALERLRMAEEAFLQAGDDGAAARAVLERARVHLDEDEDAPALELGREAARRLEAAGDLLGAGEAFEIAGRARSELADGARETWRPAADGEREVVAFLEQGAGLYAAGGDPAAAGALFERAGRRRLFSLGDRPGAARTFRRAREGFREAEDGVSLVRALAFEGRSGGPTERDRGPREELVPARLVQLLGQALELRSAGRYQEALDRYGEARGVVQGSSAIDRPSRDLLAVGLRLLEGELLFELARPGEELRAYREARRLARGAGLVAGEALAWSLECDRFGALGEASRTATCRDEAETALGTALEQLLWSRPPEGRGEGARVTEAPSPPPWAPTWNHPLRLRAESLVQLRRGDQVGALLRGLESAPADRIMGFLLSLWRSLFLVAPEGTNGLLDDPEIVPLLGEARRMLDAHGEPIEAAQMGVLEVLGRLREGDDEAARELLDELEERIAALPVGRRPGDDYRFLQGMHAIASAAALDQSRSDQAVDHIRRALAWFRSLRSGLPTAEQRARALDSLLPISRGLVDHLLEDGRPREALMAAEASRTRAFLDRLGEVRKVRTSARGPETDQARLEAELAAVETALREAGPAERRELARRRVALDRELEDLRLERLLGTLGPSTGSGEAGPLTSRGRLHLGELDRLVETAGPILYLFVVDPETVGFLLLPDGRVISRQVEAIMHWLYLEERAKSFSRHLANPLYRSRAEEQGRFWWDKLLGPFERDLPEGGPLVIVPHGPLHHFPFSALVGPDGEPLGERYQLSIAPSLSTLLELQGRHRPAAADDAFLGVAAGRGLGLPASEVLRVAEGFPAERVTVLTSGGTSLAEAAARETRTATFGAFREAAAGARQVLIASRAVAAPGDPRRTHVELAASPDHDSRLTAVEITDLALDAELVTLAACDTARSRPVLTDEQLDLARAFLLGGSAAVLATRWKLPESPRTSRFVEDFYRLYRTGGADGLPLRKDEALRRARARSRERGDPAQLWAAWVLVGDGR